jgi:hypothetical protein
LTARPATPLARSCCMRDRAVIEAHNNRLEAATSTAFPSESHAIWVPVRLAPLPRRIWTLLKIAAKATHPPNNIAMLQFANV